MEKLIIFGIVIIAGIYLYKKLKKEAKNPCSGCSGSCKIKK